MAKADNIQATERFVEDFWNGHKLESADGLFAADAAMTPGGPDMQGPEGMHGVGRSMFGAFPDHRVVVDKIVASDDQVAVRSIHTGTQTGEFMGVAPSGKEATWTAMMIFRFEDGKVVESWWEADMLGLMQQIGGA